MTAPQEPRARPDWGVEQLPMSLTDRSGECGALIIYTSGTTGRPKGAPYECDR